MEGIRIMNESWMQMAGDVSLSVFLAVAGASLFGLVLRAVAGGSWFEPSIEATGRMRRWLCEYVGNVTFGELEARGEERRRNWQVRQAVEAVQYEIAKHEIPNVETERIVEHVREAIRRGRQEPSG